jgi:hypothetical protein
MEFLWAHLDLHTHAPAAQPRLVLERLHRAHARRHDEALLLILASLGYFSHAARLAACYVRIGWSSLALLVACDLLCG